MNIIKVKIKISLAPFLFLLTSIASNGKKKLEKPPLVASQRWLTQENYTHQGKNHPVFLWDCIEEVNACEKISKQQKKLIDHLFLSKAYKGVIEALKESYGADVVTCIFAYLPLLEISSPILALLKRRMDYKMTWSRYEQGQARGGLYHCLDSMQRSYGSFYSSSDTAYQSACIQYAVDGIGMHFEPTILFSIPFYRGTLREKERKYNKYMVDLLKFFIDKACFYPNFSIGRMEFEDVSGPLNWILDNCYIRYHLFDFAFQAFFTEGGLGPFSSIKPVKLYAHHMDALVNHYRIKGSAFCLLDTIKNHPKMHILNSQKKHQLSLLDRVYDAISALASVKVRPNNAEDQAPFESYQTIWRYLDALWDFLVKKGGKFHLRAGYLWNVPAKPWCPKKAATEPLRRIECYPNNYSNSNTLFAPMTPQENATISAMQPSSIQNRGISSFFK